MFSFFHNVYYAFLKRLYHHGCTHLLRNMAEGHPVELKYLSRSMPCAGQVNRSAGEYKPFGKGRPEWSEACTQTTAILRIEDFAWAILGANVSCECTVTEVPGTC